MTDFISVYLGLAMISVFMGLAFLPEIIDGIINSIDKGDSK